MVDCIHLVYSQSNFFGQINRAPKNTDKLNCENINSKNTILYVLSNVLSKALAALAQFYAVYVLTKTQTQEDAALFFLLLGYAIWFQLLELGLSQALQNKFNSRKIASSYLMGVVLMQYAFMILIAILISCISFLVDIMLSSEVIKSNADGVLAF